MSTRTVLVTGAAQGIGKAIVVSCLQDGWKVLGCDRDGDALQHLLSEVTKPGPEFQQQAELSIYTVDISDYHQVATMFSTFDRRGEFPTHLVNNAGIYLGKSLLEYLPEEIHRVIAVNCLGAVYCSQIFAQGLHAREQRGVIVNMSSVSGQEGSSDAIYGMSKAAIIGLTQSCALSFAPDIRVNAVAPTLVTTNLLKHVPPGRIEDYRSSKLLKEPILPEDVADTVSFLLSERSKHYTGAVFDLNNGQYRR